MVSVNVKANVRTAVPVNLPSEASFQSYILQMQAMLNEANQILQDTINHSNPLAAYPVGSFYFSQNSTSPATLFGGTWEQLEQGRVLLSQGTNYPAGSTGGEATHTLTVEEMPSHDHQDTCYYKQEGLGATIPREVHYFNYSDFLGWSGDQEYTNQNLAKVIRNASTGSSQPHNNMPPYLSVYIWLRTA